MRTLIEIDITLDRLEELYENEANQEVKAILDEIINAYRGHGCVDW